MESDQGKIFVGGISWETTDEQLKEYFKAYGDVVEALIMKDRTTGRGRGFGFVVFADPDVSDRVVMDKHTINGKVVEAKKAVPRDEQQSIPKGSGIAASPASHSTRTKKIFVGGLAPNVSEDDFRQYFEQFGNITDVVVMYDHATQRPRGFGFITFDTEEAVDNVLHKTFHELKEKTVEVKRAVPKELSAASARSPTASVGGGYAGPRSSPYGAGYGQTYPSSIGAYAYPNPAAAAAAAARGGYPSYASYGGYGYGAYAGYAGGAAAYGASPGTGYGAATGYGSAGSPAGAGGYVPGSRNGWAAAAPAYGSTSPGYGGNGANYNTGTTPGWASPGPGGQGSTGSPSYGGYAYGGEGGGYGSYGGGGGSVGRSSGYSSGGYGYGGYGDGYGYPDATWRAGSADSYGGGGPNVGGGGVNGGGVGYGGGGGGGGSSVAGGGGGVEEHGPDGGSYGAYGRQSQRGVTA